MSKPCCKYSLLQKVTKREKTATFEYDKEPMPSLTLFFPTFPFDPPENIRKPKVF